jgi:LppX_LprAFG lipoprotein
MPRRLLAFLAVAAMLIAACSGTSATPVPTDPSAILSAAVSSIKDVKTVHVKVGLTGSIDAGGLFGSTGGAASTAPSAGGSSLDLSGTTIEGDVDVAHSAANLTATVPALLNLTASIIAVDGTAYIKTSLTGSQYQKLDTSDLTKDLPIPSLPAAGSPGPEASSMLSDLQQALASLPPAKILADENVNGQDCHHIQQTVSSSDLAPLASGALAGASGTATLDIWTQKSDGRPSRLVIAVDGGSQGKISVQVDLTSYDAAVTISAPPADQISDQPFTIPGITQ